MQQNCKHSQVRCRLLLRSRKASSTLIRTNIHHMWASCALNGEKISTQSHGVCRAGFFGGCSEHGRGENYICLQCVFGQCSENVRIHVVAEFVIRATSKPRFRLWVEFSEQGKSFFMQLSYVRFHVIHCWKHSPRTPKL